MTRKHLSTTKRVKIFEKEGGKCHLCGLRILVGEAWDVSHEIPLANGGADDDTNWRVAHRTCHRKHTSTVDAPSIAKTKAIHAKHIGAKVSRSPMPGGRNSKWKKKIGGGVVLR